MRFRSIFKGTIILALGICSCLPQASPAQQQGSGNSGQTSQQQQAQKPPAPAPNQSSAANPSPETPKVDPQEEAAYKAFYDVPAENAAKKIQLGEQFMQKYPSSRYAEAIFSTLTKAYFDQQQMDKMFASGDKALALNPNDVTVLVLIGWVIPHSYNPDDPNAEQRLTKAQNYEKQALELLATMPKPDNLTDDQFVKAKAAATLQAHSGLGLVYFRRQSFAESATELRQATETTGPDPADLYVLGIDLEQLKRFAEAADAYQKCAQISGPLQAACKQNTEKAKKQAATQLAPPRQ